MNEGEGTVCKEDSRRLCRGCVGQIERLFMLTQVSTGPFEQAMRLYALVWVRNSGGCVVLAGSC